MKVVKTVFHLFGATGGGAKGFKRARVAVAGMEGQWECLGSVDVDAAANRVFARRIGAPAIDLDLADREQYLAIHGHQPPADWREATPADLRRAAGGRRPNCVFLSAPCKGFSGLLSQAKSLTDKYLAMNRLTLRGVWLMLEAWADDPPELVIFENVPRLLTRGTELVDHITALFHAHGYAVAVTVHDCGEIGNLAQSRKRCLIVARRMAKVPNFLYEPPRRPLRAVGDVLGRMPLPGRELGGPMHRVPRLQWKTWVRLAFVEAGSDWRSLNKLAVEDGVLRDFLIVPTMRNGGLGVHDWGDTSGVIQARSLPTNGAFSVADPGFRQSDAWNDGHAYGVRAWDQPSATVTSKLAPGTGYGSVADPRHTGAPKHNNEFRVVRWRSAAGAITSAHATGQCVSDPRGPDGRLFGKYHCADWDEASRSVIGGDNNGAYGVADPRPGLARDREAYLTAGHYGVVPWQGSAGAVSGSACHDNGRWSVADPRPMPAIDEKLVARILSLDGTWHRPFTTLELAALQSLFDPDDPVDVAAFTGAMLDASTSDSMHREFIGNAVPPDGAQAMAEEMLRTLLLADAGETFQLSATPVWVRPIAAAINLAQGAA